MASSLDQEASQESETRLQTRPQGDWTHALQPGDMVWGKVKSHPWWPGHIFNESFAGGSVRKTRHTEGRKPNSVLVAFFGDSSYGWFDPSELIPFSPHFSDLSTQANYKSFVNAVSEASDEVSRRGALAVTCKCRDDSNFAPTGVENYVFVDVPGFERGGIYSLGQIEEARKMFDPVNATRFVTDMALGPIEAAAAYSGEDAVTFMKLRAMMVGYRRAVFEENDETYAQAFGVDPAKANRSVGPDTQLQKRERFTQRAVPLSGELKIAETLSGPNKKRPASSSSSSSSVSVSAKPTKSKQKPKPKPVSQTQHQPRFKSTPSKKTAAAAAAGASAVSVAASDDDNKYLLKRRDDAGPNTTPSPLPDLQYPLPVPDQPDTSFLVTPAAESADVAGADNSYVLQRREKKEEGEEREKKPKAKEKPLQKRKKLEGQSGVAPGVKSKGEDGSVEKKRKKKKKKLVESGSVDLDTTQVVDDLRQLALEPLYGKERGAAVPVRNLVLNFRFNVYQKGKEGKANQAASGKSDVATAERLKLKKEKKVMAAMAAKPLVKKQGLKKPDDSSPSPGGGPASSPSVLGRKRGPSDRQEELIVKKQKKLDKIKALATEKKAALANVSKVIEEEKKKEIKAQKPEAPPAPKVLSPTALMMKFPLKTALPTIATLKAKLARFGQIDLSNTRVYWNSHMCKVTFRYKDDAKAALNYVNSNEIFGQSKVQYYIRELDPPSSQEAGTGSESRAPVEPVSVRSGNRTGPEPIETRPRPSLLTQPPKSILKKPGEDSGAPVGAGNGPRVTFMLDRSNSTNSRSELPPPKAIVGDGGSVANNSVALPPPPPLASRPLLVNPAHPPFDVRHLPPPPPLLAARPGSAQWAGERSLPHGPVGPGLFDPVQPARNGPFGGFEERKKEVDISVQLLSLLRKCSDIVAKVQNSLGYMPYHPL
ncbi:hypothetical protein LUZ61_005723 [Rhynchospora tenuis]|uniref:PWWP domain-containing protein n=1 Tax=Rhynchospora tenuis TaxID=198213 RepID=A0AAD5ZQC7_9POAL|nr:hypothetical protein LUZ61_005723 [Rhynchospora tenuis]